MKSSQVVAKTTCFFCLPDFSEVVGTKGWLDGALPTGSGYGTCHSNNSGIRNGSRDDRKRFSELRVVEAVQMKPSVQRIREEIPRLKWCYDGVLVLSTINVLGIRCL